MYRLDYKRTGCLVLRFVEGEDQFMAFQAILPALALIALAPLPKLMGNAGWTYAVGAGVFNLWLSYYAAQLALRRTDA